MDTRKRSQVLRLHQRGDPAERIVAVLEIPRQEVDLLLKIHRVVTGSGQPSSIVLPDWIAGPLISSADSRNLERLEKTLSRPGQPCFPRWGCLSRIAEVIGKFRSLLVLMFQQVLHPKAATYRSN